MRNENEKKPWSRPTVRRFGTVEDLTRQIDEIPPELHCPRHLVIMPGSGITKVCGLGDAINMGS